MNRIRAGKSAIAALVLLPACVFAIGLCVERWGVFSALKEEVQTRDVPGWAFRSGKRARILVQLGLIGAFAFDPSEVDPALNWRGVPRLRQPPNPLARRPPRPLFFSLDHVRPEDLPSTTLVDRREIEKGVPLLSIAVRKADLYDPSTGLLAKSNLLKRGQAWERPAFASYMNGGKTVFGSGVGLRLHGGITRLYSPNKSFRMYLRPQYGLHDVARDIFFEEGGRPLRTVVLGNDVRLDRSDRRYQFVGSIAFEIADRIGCLVPRTKPVRFFLNGEFQGVYVLSEHLDKHLLTDRYGHDRFVFARCKPAQGKDLVKYGDPREYQQFATWARSDRARTMEEVSRRVDIENLTLWCLSILFCGTTDADQGAALLDQSRADSRWFWINWDMDLSFLSHLLKRVRYPWEFDAFAHVTSSRSGSVRGSILRGLLRTSEPYRAYFRDRFVEVMNHKFTPDFLRDLLDRYRALGATFGVEQPDVFDDIQQFFERRPAVLRQQMKAYAGAGDAFQIAISGPSGVRFEVDGFPVGASYSGWYFEGMDVRVRLVFLDGGAFSHWRVNGVDQSAGVGGTLIRRVTSDATLEAVFVQPPAASTR